MPTWERFKELCNLCFGLAVRNTCLSELARLPFLSTVQDYSDRFNVVLCHARNLSTPHKAELFVGDLPEHIKVDVELREPQDLQTACTLPGPSSAVPLPWPRHLFSVVSGLLSTRVCPRHHGPWPRPQQLPERLHSWHQQAQRF
jgi:hypothetical protein